MARSCPDCGAEVGNPVPTLLAGERNPDTLVRLCYNIHCDWSEEV